MAEETIKCSKCNEEATYDADEPHEITNQTGFVLTDVDTWLCKECINDHFNTEGC
jgi:hypothetical protein